MDQQNYISSAAMFDVTVYVFMWCGHIPDAQRLINTLPGVPGVARDEKLRKQIFEITWRDRVWIG
jgi:hypothetical protein